MKFKKLKIRNKAQSSNITFELHTLGWEAFQNLSGHIVREILGQTATIFSPTNDAGQDGAFQGVWEKSKKEAFNGRFVIQCKFTSKRDNHITMSDLEDELQKAKNLAKKKLVQCYLLITNAKVTGEADKAIRERFLGINEITYFELLGSEWITQQILASKRLRAFVPRIYGLGDLTQIIDERIYRQTIEILITWKDNLAKFVPTDAHKQSVRALLDYKFVLLLGDPMSGKSTIAAALALAAADIWHCLPIFVSHPEDFKNHWNPDEPNQFFWVDDAFGQTQVESSLTEGWNRVFPQLNAAIRLGARILFTSRTHIYQAAQRELKESAFPLIKNQRVLIKVENLSLQEKERILYNHIRLGGQPAHFRKAIKPFLESIASSAKFFPEVARRIGDPFFTKDLIFDKNWLKHFVEEPKEFLGEIIRQLDRKNFAALSLLFMRAGRITIPPKIEINELEAMSLLGANVAELREALVSLSGSLVTEALDSGERYWKLRHPSIRDAMAIHVAGRPDLIDIYLGGVKVPELLTEVVCGDVNIAGAKVQVPANRFPVVIAKLRGINLDDYGLHYNYISFLSKRCSLAFLASWFSSNPRDFDEMTKVYSVSNFNFCLILTRLHSLGCLPETHRTSYLLRSPQDSLH